MAAPKNSVFVVYLSYESETGEMLNGAFNTVPGNPADGLLKRHQNGKWLPKLGR